MAVTPAITNQFKVDITNGVHQPGDTYKIALYTQAAASLDKATTAYTATGEVSGTGYSAGGATLSGFSAAKYSTTDTIVIDFADASWSNSTITADAYMVYNSSRTNKALVVGTFSSTSSSSGTFTVVFPTPDNTTGFIRLT